MSRINRAIDHVLQNLSHGSEAVRLEAVAAAAHVSPFHFHRLFKAFTGETLGQFVKRQRLERALYLISHAPNRSLTDVALQCGFSSSSDFSRSFKQRYGQSPSALDIGSLRKTRREDFERVMRAQDGSPRVWTLPAQGNTNADGFEVAVRDLPARTMAYIRVFDPYRPGVVKAAFERLVAWADARGFGRGPWLGYMWDEPEIVAMKDCRYDAAVVVDDTFRAEGEIGCFVFAPMCVAEVVVAGDLSLEARAFDWLYGTWLPRSGYQPDDQPAMERWIGRPYAHGDDHVEVGCQLPVRR